MKQIACHKLYRLLVPKDINFLALTWNFARIQCCLCRAHRFDKAHFAYSFILSVLSSYEVSQVPLNALKSVASHIWIHKATNSTFFLEELIRRRWREK